MFSKAKTLDDDHQRIPSASNSQSVGQTKNLTDSTQTHSAIQSQRPWNDRQAVTSGVASFLDGMSRALILPFGPSLVNRLLHNTAGESNFTMKLAVDSCAKVPLPYALTVAAYIMGRGFGYWCFQNFIVPPERLIRIVARISGMIIALDVFTVGAGLQSVGWLVAIRFAAAMLVGILCAVTRDNRSELYGTSANRRSRSISEDFQNQEEGLVCTESINKRRCRMQSAGDLSSLSAIKVYLGACAISILLGGLIFRHASGDSTFQALTQTNEWPISPIFLLSVDILAESILRCVFHYVIQDDNVKVSKSSLDSRKSTSLDVSFLDCTLSPPSPTALPQKSSIRLQSAKLDVYERARDRLESASSFHSIANPRSRLETSDSDYFFDCQSVLSELEDTPFLDVEEESDSNLGVAKYEGRRVIYSDGTSAHVPCGDSPRKIPDNFLAICGGNTQKAEAMWAATQKWRREQNVWRIHRIPNKWFPEIKQAYPHFIHGFSKEGYPIIYEQPGKMNLKQLFRSGCNVSDMVRHYVFFLEYISNHVCTRQEIRLRKGVRPPPHNSSTWGIMVVMDVKGAGLSQLSGDVLSYLKRAGDINNSHYPLSLKRAFVINSPFWLAGAWSSIKGILPESVHVDLVSSHQFLRALRERIDDDQIPSAYGGSSPYKLGEHPFEQALYKLVEEADYCEDDDDENVIDYPMAPTSSLPSTASNSRLIGKRLNSNSNLRHRAASQDENEMRSAVVSFNLSNMEDDSKKNIVVAEEERTFLVVSVQHSIWMMIQGMLETIIPIWMLLPPEHGGLGYAPSRCGVALFSSSIVVLWAVAMCLKSRLMIGPHRDSMRSLRIAVGISIVILLLLLLVPSFVTGEKRTNSVPVMALTIIAMSCLVLCSLVGTTASVVIHLIACTNLATKDEAISLHWLNRIYGGNERLFVDCENGGLSMKITLASQLFGALATAPILAWSLDKERPLPLNGSFCFLLASIFCVILYGCSSSIHLKSAGGLSFNARESIICSSDTRSRRCLSLLYELIKVSVSDMASLFDENNWNSSPLLGRQGSSFAYWDQ